jgi:hypothetical protein
MSGPTMTGEERVAYLVELAMEAVDHVGGCAVDDITRRRYEDRLAERMRQGCQVWQAEVDMAKEESR